jgi:hypothetical protein
MNASDCPNCHAEGWPSQLRSGEHAHICGSRSFDDEVIGKPTAACKLIDDLRRRLALQLVA